MSHSEYIDPVIENLSVFGFIYIVWFIIHDQNSIFEN